MNSRLLRSIASSAEPNELLATLDVEELLKSSDCESNLEGKTLDSIQREIYETLVEHVPSHQIDTIFHKLAGYQFVDEIYKLHRGKHARWIPIAEHCSDKLSDKLSNKLSDKLSNKLSDKLSHGGVVLSIKFTDTGPLVLCRAGQRFIQYRFNECITFQKLSEDELLILAAYNAISDTLAR